MSVIDISQAIHRHGVYDPDFIFFINEIINSSIMEDARELFVKSKEECSPQQSRARMSVTNEMRDVFADIKQYGFILRPTIIKSSAYRIRQKKKCDFICPAFSIENMRYDCDMRIVTF